MGTGNVIIGVFVRKYRILSFLEFLHNKLKICIDKVFIFNVENNDKEYLVTFSANKSNQSFFKLHDITILHVKNGCLFSINALNMYINERNINHINNTSYKVNWGVLKNMLLITTNGKLNQLKIQKVEDKCVLLNDLS